MENEKEVKKQLDDAYHRGYQDGYDYGRKTGLSAAWEAARKLFMPESKGGLPEWAYPRVLGDVKLSEALIELEPEDVLSRIKAWEEDLGNINVGDVVEWLRSGGKQTGVVTDISPVTDYVNVLTANGYTTLLKWAQLRKTGRHIDIAGVLAQIGGE